MLGPDRLCGDQAFVGVGRWHANVDHGDVGRGLPHLSEELIGVCRLGHDLDAGVAEQADDPGPGEHGVVRHDYAHGISPRNDLGSIANVPPSATTRSTSRTGSSLRSAPSSSTVTTRSITLSDGLDHGLTGPAARGVVDCLPHQDVGSHLDRVPTSFGGVGLDLHVQRRDVGKTGERRAEARRGQDRGIDPVRELPQIVESGQCLGDSLARAAPWLGSRRRTRPPPGPAGSRTRGPRGLAAPRRGGRAPAAAVRRRRSRRCVREMPAAPPAERGTRPAVVSFSRPRRSAGPSWLSEVGEGGRVRDDSDPATIPHHSRERPAWCLDGVGNGRSGRVDVPVRIRQPVGDPEIGVTDDAEPVPSREQPGAGALTSISAIRCQGATPCHCRAAPRTPAPRPARGRRRSWRGRSPSAEGSAGSSTRTRRTANA